MKERMKNLTQSRKAAKQNLCAFAPWRENLTEIGKENGELTGTVARKR